jgi:molecular chaperone IbpA
MIGVDRMADLIDSAMKSDGSGNWPPYDIEKTGDDAYRITIAAAGFSSSEIQITAQPNLLIVAGQKAESDEGRTYLHRGIAGRGFERRFELADYVVVKAASQEHGVLTIDLAREVPEALRPRRIEIAAGQPPQAAVQNDKAPRRIA